MNEKQLTDGCRKNDRHAQNLLFSQYERRVLAISLRYTTSRDEAMDIQQESFIKIFASLSSKRSAREFGSLDAWVHRLTVNTAIDHYRKRANFPVDERVTEEAVLAPAVLDKLHEEELIRLIQTLPDNLRLVFNLFIIEGFSHREIGEMLGVSESTSRSYLTRAKDCLRKLLHHSDSKANRYA